MKENRGKEEESKKLEEIFTREVKGKEKNNPAWVNIFEGYASW